MDYSVKIGTEYYSITNNYTISQQIAGVSSSEIDVLVVDGQAIPQTLQSVEIYDEDDTLFFSGIIQNIVSPTYSTGYEVKRYRLSISSLECIFNNRLVSEAYENKYIHEIVSDLFTNYISEENIDLGIISDSEYQYTNYNVSFTKLYDVLTELAEKINASFYISADRKFYFITREEFNYVETPQMLKMINMSEDAGEMRNVQVVAGASEETSTQTENIVWVTDQTNFNVGYQVSSVSIVSINGTPAGVGIKGVDEDDTSITFLWQFGSNTITVNNNATVKPTASQNVVIQYQGYYDIVITNINDQLVSQIAALNGTSGKIENILIDETLDNYTDADGTANSLLDQFSERERELSLVCHDLTASELFNVWVIDFPDLNLSGDFLVCERVISDFGELPMINVKMKSKNFYTKYGTVLKKDTKKSGENVKVYKQTTIGDTVTVSESYVFDSAGIVYYPTSSAYIDGLTIPFYPV